MSICSFPLQSFLKVSLSQWHQKSASCRKIRHRILHYRKHTAISSFYVAALNQRRRRASTVRVTKLLGRLVDRHLLIRFWDKWSAEYSDHVRVMSQFCSASFQLNKWNKCRVIHSWFTVTSVYRRATAIIRSVISSLISCESLNNFSRPIYNYVPIGVPFFHVPIIPVT